MKRRPSVLVVDDDARMRLAMTRVLERGGYEVTRCKDGREALDALRARPWAAMVSDVRMPRMNGRELLREALAIRPELRVVLITGFGTIGDAVDAVRHGACDYMLKPFAPETLLDAVSRATAAGAEAGSTAASGAGSAIVGEDPKFRALLDEARRTARTDATVLISGESGTGKEVVARFIHQQSARADGPFVAVNCAALPPDLLEAELFGWRRGAFTSADQDRTGHFARASGGTLLLDEIGDCPPALQPKLLRALEEKVIVPLGASEPVPVDLRVIAATHMDLVAAVAEGSFRQDLYYRLRVIPLEIIPLRDRRKDIVPLARHFVRHFAERDGRRPPALGADAVRRLEAHPWPGNVRELRNVIERSVVLDRGGTIGASDLFLDEWDSPEEEGGRLVAGMTIAEAERRLIETTLDATNGNRTHASRMLGISVRTLRNKLRIYREEAAGADVPADARAGAEASIR